MIRPEDVPGAFVADGTCRSVYVLDATPADWLALLHLARDRRTYASRFTVGDRVVRIPDALPEQLWVTPDLSSDGCAHLAIDLGGVTLHCDFLSPEEIELDVDPRELQNSSFFALIEFMESLGRRTGRDVLLTPEIHPEAPIFLYEAATDRVVLPHQRQG